MQQGMQKHTGNFHEKVLEAVEQAVIVTDLGGSIIYWNSFAEKLYGWKAEEALGENIRNVTVPEISRDQAEEIMTRVSKGESWSGDFHVQNKGGKRFFTHVTNSPLTDENGSLTGIIGISFDVSKRKQTEIERDRVIADLNERVKELRCLYEFSRIVETSSTIEEILEGLVRLIPPAWKYPEITAVKITYEGNTYNTTGFYETEWSLSEDIIEQKEKVGTIEVVYTDKMPERDEGPFLEEERKLLQLLADQLGSVIQRIRAENKIRELLAEKETLLQEVHHRVKNNITIIASLLSLQANTVKSGEGKRALLETRNRVVSMQKLYTHLFRSDVHTKISAGTYLNDVIQEIGKTYGEDRITIFTAIEDISVEVKKAVPLGIIVNELVVNSIKYAFPDSAAGIIEIVLKKIDDTQNELIVNDNGRGLPEDYSTGAESGFGLGLVHTLVKQIEGSLDIASAEGTEFKVTFSSKGENHSVSRPKIE